MCCVSSVSRCSLHMSDLCVCMRGVISELNSEIEKSHAICVLVVVYMWRVYCHLRCCVCLSKK